MNRKLFVIFVLALVFIIAAYFSPLHEPIKAGACSIVSGKFSVSTKECIFKNCAETGSCQPSYGNSFACKKLKPDLTKNELLFELGMPVRVEGSAYYFSGNVGEKNKVKATILNGKVEHLECEI